MTEIIPTQDPKYGIQNNRIVNTKTGEPIPDDEPIFIIRAKDMYSATTLKDYRIKCQNPEHRHAVGIRMVEFWTWRRKNNGKIKEPDT